MRRFVKERVMTEYEEITRREKEKKALHEEVWRRMVPCENAKEDVMARFYGITSNKCKPIRLDEYINLDRIIQKHGENGFVIVSASRPERSQEENDKETKDLIEDIKSCGFSFIPVYGGYRSPDSKEDGDYEAAFMIFNYDAKGNSTDFTALLGCAIKWCGKYGQDCVLVKAPGKAPIYVDGCEMEVNRTESMDVLKNDPLQTYFTLLKGKEDVQKEIDATLMGEYKTYCRKKNFPISDKGFATWKSCHQNDVKQIERRFTCDIQFECYINPLPCTLNERRRRGNELYLCY